MGSEGTKEKSFRWAREMFNNGFMVIDFQTTDLADNGGRVCQVGLVDQNGAIIMETLVNPNGAKVAPGAYRIHGLSNEQLAKAQMIEPVWELVNKMRGDKALVSYGRDFDRAVLLNSYPDVEQSSLFTWYCLMDEFAPVAGMWNDYRQNYRWVKLAEACKIAGVQMRDAGSAVGNCLMTYDVLKWMSGQAVQKALL